MRKAAWILIAITVLAGAGVAIYFALEDDSGGSETTVTSGTTITTGATGTTGATVTTVTSGTTVTTVTTTTSSQYNVFEYNVGIYSSPADYLRSEYNSYTNVTGSIDIYGDPERFPLGELFNNLLGAYDLSVQNITFDNSNAFQNLEKISDILGIYEAWGDNIFDNAFPELIKIGDGEKKGGLDIELAFSSPVTTLSTAFPKLKRILGFLEIYGNSNPLSLGSAFASLRRVKGHIIFEEISNFTALDDLECHGGVYNDSSTDDFCPNCPDSLRHKSFCCGEEGEMDCSDCNQKTCTGNDVPPKALDNLCLCCLKNEGYAEKQGQDEDGWECIDCEDVGMELNGTGFCDSPTPPQ